MKLNFSLGNFKDENLAKEAINVKEWMDVSSQIG
jgi:hypothetical protein